jgi:predicted transcriptional regulator YheO
MVNPQKGEIQIKLGNELLKARLTIDALIRIENANGSSIVQTAQKLSEGRATITEIVNVIYPAIKGGGNKVDQKDVVKKLETAGLINGMRVAGEILTVALNSGLKDEGNEVAEENLKT